MLVHVPGVATVSWWQKSGNTKIKRERLCTQPAKQGASCDTRSVDATLTLVMSTRFGIFIRDSRFDPDSIRYFEYEYGADSIRPEANQGVIRFDSIRFDSDSIRHRFDPNIDSIRH